MITTLLAAACLYVVMSVVTFAAYARDKRAAVRGAWRVRECTLHLLGLTFGWPGAMAARRVLRHKTRKAGFTAVLWGTAVLHAAAWVTVVWAWLR